MRGENGDAWTAFQSPIGGQISKAIAGDTTYTLTCKDLSGQTVTKQAKVRVIPGFRGL